MEATDYKYSRLRFVNRVVLYSGGGLQICDPRTFLLDAMRSGCDAREDTVAQTKRLCSKAVGKNKQWPPGRFNVSVESIGP